MHEDNMKQIRLIWRHRAHSMVLAATALAIPVSLSAITPAAAAENGTSQYSGGSWQHEFHAENPTQGDSFWFNIATKF